MRLRQVVREAMLGAATYNPPSEPSQMMADFYVQGFLHQGTQYITSIHQDQLEFELDQVEKIIVPHLRNHLLKAAGYSICCELRHARDQVMKLTNAGQKTVHDRMPPGSPDKRYGGSRLLDMLIRPISPSLLRVYTKSKDRPSFENIMACFPNIGTLAKVINAAQPLFKTSYLKDDEYGPLVVWNSSYGGAAWEQACKYWLNLYNASSLPEMSIHIDRIYDLEHNTGALLDKNPEYTGGWLKKLLDIKLNAQSPEELIRFCSGPMRKLSLIALKSLYGRGWDTGPLSKQTTASDRMNANFRSKMANELVTAFETHGYKCDRSQTTTCLWIRVYDKDVERKDSKTKCMEIRSTDDGIRVDSKPRIDAYDIVRWDKQDTLDVEDNHIFQQLLAIVKSSPCIDNQPSKSTKSSKPKDYTPADYGVDDPDFGTECPKHPGHYQVGCKKCDALFQTDPN